MNHEIETLCDEIANNFRRALDGDVDESEIINFLDDLPRRIVDAAKQSNAPHDAECDLASE